MPIPKALARVNRLVANPVIRRFAGWMPWFCVLTHEGRRTGRRYRIPVNVFGADGRFVFALFYGADTDWVKNVVANGGCTIRHLRQDLRLSNPRLIGEREGMSQVPAPLRPLLRSVDVTEFLVMEAT